MSTAAIKRIDHKKSTFGYEILNEPQVFRQEDFKKVAVYHDYFLKNLEESTEKTLFFCYTSSGSFTAFDFPWMQTKTNPSINIKNNIVFDVHPYPPYSITMLYYRLISILMKNIPLSVGEFNSGIGNNTTINLRQYKQYLKILKRFSISHAAFWEWSYIIDNYHPAFNLTKIVDQKIHANANFENYINAIKETID